jgi:hypothetical protein
LGFIRIAAACHDQLRDQGQRSPAINPIEFEKHLRSRNHQQSIIRKLGVQAIDSGAAPSRLTLAIFISSSVFVPILANHGQPSFDARHTMSHAPTFINESSAIKMFPPRSLLRSQILIAATRTFFLAHYFASLKTVSTSVAGVNETAPFVKTVLMNGTKPIWPRSKLTSIDATFD